MWETYTRTQADALGPAEGPCRGTRGAGYRLKSALLGADNQGLTGGCWQSCAGCSVRTDTSSSVLPRLP
jgi:hypothetical protein